MQQPRRRKPTVTFLVGSGDYVKGKPPQGAGGDGCVRLAPDGARPGRREEEIEGLWLRGRLKAHIVF